MSGARSPSPGPRECRGPGPRLRWIRTSDWGPAFSPRCIPGAAFPGWICALLVIGEKQTHKNIQKDQITQFGTLFSQPQPLSSLSVENMHSDSVHASNMPRNTGVFMGNAVEWWWWWRGRGWKGTPPSQRGWGGEFSS